MFIRRDLSPYLSATDHYHETEIPDAIVALIANELIPQDWIGSRSYRGFDMPSDFYEMLWIFSAHKNIIKAEQMIRDLSGEDLRFNWRLGTNPRTTLYQLRFFVFERSTEAAFDLEQNGTYLERVRIDCPTLVDMVLDKIPKNIRLIMRKTRQNVASCRP